MEQATVVLEGIKRTIREVVRLIQNNVANKDRCLLIIDQSLSRIDSLRGVADADHVSAVEESLQALRSEVYAAEDTADGAGSSHCSYTAERPLSGIIFCQLLFTTMYRILKHWKKFRTGPQN